MAVSGSSDYSRTAQQIIRSSLRLLGITQSGEVPTAAEQTDALEAFEMMIKSFQGQGYHLWTYAEATLFITPGTESYTMDGSSSRAVSSFTETTTSAAASSTDTTVTLTSVTGVADTYVIGIQESSSSIFWTTVNGAPSGSVVTLTDALTSDIASGSTVYVYPTTNLIVRPLRIESIRRRNSSQDTPIIEYSREEYFNLPNKSSQSTPTQFYYDPGRSSGTLYLWPTGNTVNDLMKITYLRPIQDIDAVANDTDFPQEWLETLKYNLAVRLAPEYGKTLPREVALMAESLLEEMKGWDVEPVSVYMSPNLQGW